MKNSFNLFFAAFILLSFTSCSIKSEVTLHKDATASTLMDVDMRNFFKIMKDSTFAFSTKQTTSFDKIPKTWTSYYDLRQRENKFPIPKDSAEIYKKMLMKANFESDELVGFSMKINHFSRQDYAAMNARKESDMPVNNAAYENWDGKTLKIDTKKLVSKELMELLAILSGKQEIEKMAGKADHQKDESMMKFTTLLKFETPIRSFSGKHPWIKKVDGRTIKIEFSTDDVSKASSRELDGGELTVITE